MISINEQDYQGFKKIIILLVITQVFNIFIIGWIVTGEIISQSVLILITGGIILGECCLFVVEQLRKEYLRSIENIYNDLLQIPIENKPIPSIDTKPVSEQVQKIITPRWSVVQYRGFNDFMFGSFDAYVVEEEIIIRGRLKKGQNSLYMRIVKPSRR